MQAHKKELAAQEPRYETTKPPYPSGKTYHAAGSLSCICLSPASCSPSQPLLCTGLSCTSIMQLLPCRELLPQVALGISLAGAA